MSIPRARLTVVDLHHFIDWVEKDWVDEEMYVTRRLQRLRRHLVEALDDPHLERALVLYGQLCEARLCANRPWRSIIVELRAVVAAWERERPPLVVCGFEYGNGVRCTIASRSGRMIAEHRSVVHGVEP